jgi:predicted DNA-binding protein YlxM (UPF0122 family)
MENHIPTLIFYIVGRSDMNKKERLAQLAEMQRLYTKENLTLQEIGDLYGITKQAVRDRFLRHGVQTIRKRPHKMKKPISRETLVQLYVTEEQRIDVIAKQLHISSNTLWRELKKHDIKTRIFAVVRTRHWELIGLMTELEVGNKMSVLSRQGEDDYTYIYKKAKQIGIDISIKQVNKKSLLITRVR